MHFIGYLSAFLGGYEVHTRLGTEKRREGCVSVYMRERERKKEGAGARNTVSTLRCYCDRQLKNIIAGKIWLAG